MAPKQKLKKVTRKRREKKLVERGAAHIRSSFNNTIVTLTDTNGNGIMNHVFDSYEPYKGDIQQRVQGSIIAHETGEATAYGLFYAQERGRLFIGPGVEVYEGMIVGANPKTEDITVNVCKKKHATNTRAAGSDDALKLVPHSQLSLEQCLEFIAEDELVEVTPKSIRMRKAILSKELRMKQAAAAVGQCRMMHIYDKLFAEYNRTVAQILLTGEDVESPVRSEHLHNTFEALLELGVIPVVNENDSVSSAEIETGQCKVLGDNDTLSAIVARLCGAGLLVLFSDIDGLYDAAPRTRPDARLIHQVEAITPELRAMAGGAGTWRGTGGMATKLNAAQLCLEAGVDMVIANGKRPQALYDIAQGRPAGTRFLGKKPSNP